MPDVAWIDEQVQHFDGWRQTNLRLELETVLTKQAAKPGRRQRRLASLAELPPNSVTDQRKLRINKSLTRFVQDRFANRAETRAVRKAVEISHWNLDQSSSFVTASVESHLRQARLAGQDGASKELRRLRDKARQLLSDVFRVEQTLYHAHSTLTCTRSVDSQSKSSDLAAKTKIYTDQEATCLFEAIRLKDAGNSLYRRGLYERAILVYTQCLQHLPSSNHTEFSKSKTNAGWELVGSRDNQPSGWFW